MLETIYWKNVPDWWVVHPDRVEEKINEWKRNYGDFVSVRVAKQFTRNEIFAVTITDPSVPVEEKKLACFLNVHTMEYGACAGIMNFANMLITGKDLIGNDASFDAKMFREKFVVTLIPDGNPQGKLRLPFSFTDGTQIDNNDKDTVNKLYYGIHNGKPFKRVPSFKMSEEHVELVGAIYEKISPDEYVIPDMDERSTVLRFLYALGYEYHYQMVGFIHQAEFSGMEENCYCATSIEPWISPPMQELQNQWARFVIEQWKKIGGRPIEKIDHHHWGADSWIIEPATGYVRKVGNDFATLRFNCPSIIMETQMNDPRTPPEEQMRLTTAGIEASLKFWESTK